MFNYNHYGKFNAQDIKFYLNSDGIYSQIVDTFRVKTGFIEITPDKVINRRTGKTLLEIPRSGSIVDYVKQLTTMHYNVQTEDKNDH